ncbi:MAG TPA: extracellular solute-binding protein, partial [Chloroflexota bacterium]|nr:extracellular solute-binding protein [Chloroflexota bacterium]
SGMLRRRAVLGAAGGAGAGVLAACAAGGEGTGGGAEAPRAARKAVTLHYWSRFGPGQSRPYVQTGEYEDQRLPLFMEQQAPVKVERTAISNHTELLDKLTVAFVSGTGPDVFNIGSPGVAQFAHPGFLLPLDGYPRSKKEAADFFESGLRIGSYKGKLYGFTYYADMRIMLYRKDLLAQAGLPAERQALPKTWDQLRELARKLTRWEGGQISRIGFDVPKTDEALWFNVVHQQGVDVLNKELTRATVGGPEGERALQLMVDLLHRDRVDANERPTFPAGVPAIGSQYMASGYRSSAELENFRQSNLDPQQLLVSDFTPEWTGKTTATGYLGGTWVLVAKQNKDADAALDLQLFLASYDQLIGVAEIFSGVPPRKSADKWAPLKDPLLRTYFEAEEKAYTVPGHPKFEQIRVKSREVMGQALKQERSVKEAVADLAAFTNALLASA